MRKNRLRKVYTKSNLQRNLYKKIILLEKCLRLEYYKRLDTCYKNYIQK